MSNSNIETKRIIKEKQSGTLLDGRYEISSIIGKGGFSVVYEAVNIHTKQQVAIKECTLQESKPRFLREARILHDFSEESSIVSVFDSFEENGTAYIVMEYLDGITLREHIKDAGKYSAEEVVQLFSPVMETLIHLHKTGVIHRDISPDNIMLMKDGSLKLLDFGAAQNFRDSKVSSLVFKSSYSPPEQMDDKGELGPYTDVYSLCATMYFCLTGTDPDDVMSRLLLDELRLPSEFGAVILPQAEKALIKGLTLDRKKRLQSMYQLKKELEDIYPVLTDEEKKEISRKKKIRKKRIVAAGITVLLIAGLIVYTNRIRISLSLTDTESLIFDGSTMTEEQFKENSVIVRDRIDALTNGYFLWTEENKKVRIVIPQKVFGEEDPVSYCTYTIARPMVIYFGIENDDVELDSSIFITDPFSYIDILSQPDDIQAVKHNDQGIQVEVSENTQTRLSKYLDQKGITLKIAFDIEHTADYVYYNAKTAGDGKTITIINDRNGLQLPDKLQDQIFTKKSLGNEFTVYPENLNDRIEWYTTGKPVTFGRYQKTDSEMDSLYDGSLACLSYDCVSGDIDDTVRNSIIFTLQKRLDSLGTPYSIGIDRYDNNKFWVKVFWKDIYIDEADLLGETVNFHFGSQYGQISDELISATPTIDTSKEPATATIEILESDYERLKNITTKLINDGETELYLYANNVPVAHTDLNDVLKSLETSKTVVFTDWNLRDPSLWDNHIADYLDVLHRNSPEEYISRGDSYCVDNAGIIMDNTLPAIFVSLDDDTVNKWDSEFKHMIFRYDSHDRSLSVIYLYDYYHDDIDRIPIKSFFQFYHENKNLLESGLIQYLSLSVFSSDNPVSKDDNGVYRSRTMLGMCSFDMDYRTGKFGNPISMTPGLVTKIRQENNGEFELADNATV